MPQYFIFFLKKKIFKAYNIKTNHMLFFIKYILVVSLDCKALGFAFQNNCCSN